MQELLGRIAALDPEASLGIRVIACFDELMAGNVNTRAHLSAAASLAGCVAGFAPRQGRGTRIDHRGLPVAGAPPLDRTSAALPDGAEVWLERVGAPGANDAIILERLALAVGVRLGARRDTLEPVRDLGAVVDAQADPEERQAAAARLGLRAGTRYRILAAPLFAVWGAHPPGNGDVISTPHGPIHVVAVGADAATYDVRPAGLGLATEPDDLPRSFRTAVVALRLARPPAEPLVDAEQFGSVLELLADVDPDAPDTDADRVAALTRHAWADDTIAALVRAASLREAARIGGVHHSTMQSRVETIAHDLGFDPFDGFGRTRLCLAHLRWRLRTSRVLDLPPPA